ncbi:MAG TPA: hypothetical protein DEA08_22880, partial [Planctomycetes bacterium]|nr:hypothetical protein [Planctomycetota bacterium]
MSDVAVPTQRATVGAFRRTLQSLLGPWFSTIPERLIVFQLACQIGMLIPYLAPLRKLFRAGSFGSSGVVLVYLLATRRGGEKLHPATRPVAAVLALLLLSLLHPETNSVKSALAQIAMYVSILGPLLWVAYCRCEVDGLRRVLLILLAFHALSSFFGVLQATYPGEYQPALAFEGSYQHEIRLASGERVLRPMGLTDSPGGAATSGFYAVLLGTCFLVAGRTRKTKTLGGLGIALGMFCLYLAQSRSRFLMTIAAVAVFVGILGLRGQLKRLVIVFVIGQALALGSFAWAVSVGGDSATRRLRTLVEDDPGELAYERGYFLEETFVKIIPKYPLGAGMARWGQMYAYFGDRNSSPPIYVEVQLTGWILDGGIPLAVLYYLALGMATWVAWRLATRLPTG